MVVMLLRRANCITDGSQKLRGVNGSPNYEDFKASITDERRVFSLGTLAPSCGSALVWDSGVLNGVCGWERSRGLAGAGAGGPDHLPSCSVASSQSQATPHLRAAWA